MKPSFRFLLLCSTSIYTIAVHAMFLELNAPKQYTTYDAVIRDYFFAPDKVVRFFQNNMGADNFSEQPLQEEISWSEYENKAGQYSDRFQQYGTCTYAIESDNRILAGFSNGSLVSSNTLPEAPGLLLVPPRNFPVWGSKVTTCRFVNSAFLSNELQHDVNNTLVLAGHSNNQVSVWGREVGCIKILVETNKTPLSIIDGHFQNIFIVKHSDGFSLVGINKGKPASLVTASNIVSNALYRPYQCGVAIKTEAGSFLIMPYSQADYAAIKACNFSFEQKACLLRLIFMKKAGLKIELQDSEKPHFAALPLVMQKMLNE